MKTQYGELPSKIVRYKAESKHPHKSAYYMCQNGASFLWDEYDSAECKDWEIESEKGVVTLYLFYKGVVDGESYEDIIQSALEEFWQGRGVKFSTIQG